MSNLRTPGNPAPSTTDTSRLRKKKLEYQLVLWASSSNILLTRGHFLLVSVHDFIRGRLARTLTKLETLLAQQENRVVPDYSLVDGTFLKPCTSLLAVLEEAPTNTLNLLQKPRALTICMENLVIQGKIQMERVIPVEIFRKKSNNFRGITFFPFFNETTEIFYTICLVNQCQASS